MLKRLGAKSKVPHDKPFERLKALRQRAGYKQADVNRLLGYKTPSGYPQYEKEARMGSKPIPEPIIKKLVPIFVGRGMPAITVDEVLSLGNLTPAVGPSVRMTAGETNSVYPQRTAFTATGVSNNASLRVRVRAERGAFMEFGLGDFGPSSLGAEPGIPLEAQLCVAVLDNHAEKFGYPAGTQLHCCFPDMFGVGGPLGKKVVMWLQRGNTGLGETIIAQFKGKGPANDDTEWLGLDASGAEIKGRPVGVVLRSLRKE